MAAVDQDVSDAVDGIAYGAVAADEPQDRMGARSAAMSIWGQIAFAQRFVWWRAIGPHACKVYEDFTLDTFRSYLMYMVEHPSQGRRRTPMNVDDMVDRWIPIIKGLATAHDKADVDRCEFESETHLAPLLTAPVKQVREFYAALVVALKADPQIPFFVWAMFEGWGDTILKHAPDEDVKQLKTKLAAEIADLVEKDVQPDIKAAIAGALQWRSEKSLQEIKAAVETGAKPRIRGRESCLFLEAGNACVML